MKYDFDRVIDRRGSDSYKWDTTKPGELPMWVADMDFETAPAIKQALAKRVEHGVFGYSFIPDKWYDAVQGWWLRRHGLTTKKDWWIFCTGVVPAISTLVTRLTNVGDNVVIQTPVYNVFFNSIVNHGRHILENTLSFDGKQYTMNFADLEEKLSNPLTTLMILCNPQNPVGKIWDKDTLHTVSQLCDKYGVTVISDEIHCDLTAPDTDYVPYMTACESLTNVIALVAPSKTFNLAGLNTSAVIVADTRLRNKVSRALNSHEVAEPNAFAVTATVTAFDSCEDWLNQLRCYIFANRRRVKAFLDEQLPELNLIEGNATYLLWIDCAQVTSDSEQFCNYLREKTGLFVTAGAHYGQCGRTFIRVNIACPRKTLEQGLALLKKGVEMYKNR